MVLAGGGRQASVGGEELGVDVLGDGEVGGVIGGEGVAHRPDAAGEWLDGVADNPQFGQELERSFGMVGGDVAAKQHAAEGGDRFDVEVLGDVDSGKGASTLVIAGAFGAPASRSTIALASATRRVTGAVPLSARTSAAGVGVRWGDGSASTAASHSPIVGRLAATRSSSST